MRRHSDQLLTRKNGVILLSNYENENINSNMLTLNK